MSSSLFRHEWGTEQALRMRDTGEFGPLQYVIASQGGGYSPDGWFVYGQHPVWTVMTLLRPRRRGGQHVRPRERLPRPGHLHRPHAGGGLVRPARHRPQYCHTSVHFTKKTYEYTPAIEGDFWFGHHYEMFRMAATFREMVRRARSRCRTRRSWK